MKALLTIFLLAISINSFSQAFIRPVEPTEIMSPSFMKSATAVYLSGEEVVGVKFGSAILTNGGLASFTLKTSDGGKVKFKAAEVSKLSIELNGFATFMMAADGNSIKETFENYFYEGGKDQNIITFEQVEIKPGKFKLLQLLNPDTDERIKVYLDPTAQQGSMSGEDKSYYVQKGDRSFKLKKKKYDDEFENLFGDSEIMMKFLKEKQIKLKFKNFAGHVELYNQTFSW